MGEADRRTNLYAEVPGTGLTALTAWVDWTAGPSPTILPEMLEFVPILLDSLALAYANVSAKDTVH